MPDSTNGDIRLSVSASITTDNVMRDARNLKKAIDEILDSKDTKGNPKLEKLALQIEKSYASVEKLQRKMEQTQSIRVPTDQYKKLDAELEEARQKTEELIAEREKWSHASGTAKFFAAGEIEKIEAEFDQVLKKMEEIERRKAELEQSGGAFEITGNTDQIAQQLHFATANGEQLVGRFKEAASSAAEAAAGSSKLGMALKAAGAAAKVFGKVAKAAFNGVKAGIRAFRSGIEKVKSGFSKLKNTVSKTFNHINKNSKHGLKTLIRYGLGVRGLFALFRKLRGYATDAFKGIAQSSSSFNKTMSNITNTFSQFKGSIGTMLQPIITIIEPILIRIMNLFINAANAVGTFFATLTGQKYIYKAVKANNSYADSVEGTGKAAKEANKQLAEYDKLMVIQSQDAADAAGGSGGGGGGFTEELIDPTNSVSKFAQDLKEAWENEDFAAIGELVAGKINEVVGKIDEAINWENIGPKVEDFMEKFGTAFNSMINAVDWPLIGKTIGDGLNTITYTIQSFLDNFDLDDLGGKLAIAFNSLTSTVDWPAIGKVVSSGLNEITSAVNQFAANTDWKSLGEDIASLFDSLLDNLNADALGSALAAPIESITEYIDGFLKKFDENGTWAKYGSKIATAINSWFSSINWKMVSSNITSGVDGVVTAIDTLFDETHWKDIGADLGEVINGVINIDWKNVGKTLSDGVGGLFDVLKSGLDTIDFEQLGKDLVDLLIGIDWPALFKNVSSTIFQIVYKVWDFVTGIVKEFNLGDFVETVVKSIVGWFSGFDFSQVAPKISEFAGALIGNIVSSLVNIAIDLGEFVVKLIENIKTWFENKKSEWDEAGLSIWEGIFQGIWNGIKNIGHWIMEKIVDPFIQGFKDAFKIHSPSKVMEEMGGYLIDGLKEGLSNIWEAIKGKFTEMLGKIKDWFVQKKEDLVKAWDAFKSGIGEVVTNLKAKVEESFTKAKEAWDNMTSKAKDAIANIKAKVEEGFTKAKEAWNNLGEKGKELLATLKGKTEEAFNTAKTAWEGLSTTAKELWAKLKASTEEAFTKAKSTWDGLSTAAKDLWANLKGKTEEAFTTVKTKWEGLSTTAKELWAKLFGKKEKSFDDTKAAIDDIPKTKNVTIGAGFGSNVQKTVTGWWSKIKSWFQSSDSYKKSGGKLTVGATAPADKSKVQTWWDNMKAWWGKKNLGVTGSLTVTAAQWGKGVTVKGNAVVDLNSGTSGPGGHYTMATGGIVRRRLDNVTIGENGPEAVIPLKNNTEWLNTVSRFVLAHLNMGKIDIPKLAQGRVIPPNREFIAMLGDQRSGTNVETPLKTIEQALENVLSRARGGGQPIILQLDGKQIAQAVWNESDKRYKQTGRSYA